MKKHKNSLNNYLRKGLNMKTDELSVTYDPQLDLFYFHVPQLRIAMRPEKGKGSTLALTEKELSQLGQEVDSALIESHIHKTTGDHSKHTAPVLGCMLCEDAKTDTL